MKKKLIITVSILIITVLTSAVCFALNSTVMAKKSKPSDYHVGITYTEAISQDKPILALFYADWCGYCLRFMPKFQSINKLYKDKFSIVMLDVENPDNKALVDDCDLTGFPTLYILDPKYENRVLLNNALYLNLAKLRGELDRYLKIRAMLDKSQSCEAKQ